jgi:hypothetical protein
VFGGVWWCSVVTGCGLEMEMAMAMAMAIAEAKMKVIRRTITRIDSEAVRWA